jgi:hypothetical protein
MIRLLLIWIYFVSAEGCGRGLFGDRTPTPPYYGSRLDSEYDNRRSAAADAFNDYNQERRVTTPPGLTRPSAAANKFPPGLGMGSSQPPEYSRMNQVCRMFLQAWNVI